MDGKEMWRTGGPAGLPCDYKTKYSKLVHCLEISMAEKRFSQVDTNVLAA